jgi:putative Mn2+ efflux pump MntP
MQAIFLCSLDSFVAALGIGLIDCSKTTRRKVILAFAVCDLLATLAGASLRRASVHIHYDGLASFLVPFILSGVALAVLAYGRKLPTRLMWIPVLLSLDNFVAGLWDGSAHGPESAVIAGLFSGLLAWSGFVMARVAGSFFLYRVALATSAGLTIIAFVFLS